MLLKQISVFLENRAGRLPGIIKKLGGAGIDILAISLADTSDFGILRLLVNDVTRAEQILHDAGIVCRVNDVTVVAVNGVPGGLAQVMDIVEQAGVNIEYMYAIAQTKLPDPLMVFRFSERERAREVLRNAGVRIYDEL